MGVATNSTHTKVVQTSSRRGSGHKQYTYLSSVHTCTKVATNSTRVHHKVLAGAVSEG